MEPLPPILGIIAGQGTLPLVAARQARAAGIKQLVAVAFQGETERALTGLVDQITWVKVGQLQALISAFKNHGARHCIMVGQVAPKNLFQLAHLRPDRRALDLLMSLKEKNAHTIFGAIAAELQRDGIELITAEPLLEPCMPRAGFHLGPTLTEEQKRDVDFGYRIAKEVSRLEIGQTVVVKNGSVLAVEGFEGTDKCLARGGGLAGQSGGAVAVKVAKARHDMRFDIPCVGPRTIKVAIDAGVAVIAFEAGRTLLLEEEIVTKLSRKQSISVVAIVP
jgi:DUF1009 family protein